MRCKACNSNLSDGESTRLDIINEYVDMCSSCLASIRYAKLEDDIESEYLAGWSGFIPKLGDNNDG